MSLLVSRPSLAVSAAPTLFDDTSLSLNGADEDGSVVNDASIDWTSAMTMMVWIYVGSQANSTNDCIWYFRVGASAKSYFKIHTNTGTARFHIRAGGGTNLDVANAFREHEWDQFVCVWDGTDMFLYRNGVQIGTVGKTGTSGATSANPTQFNGQGFGRFRGFCSQMALWVDNGLTAGEVTTLYNGGVPYDIASSGPDAGDLKMWLRNGNGTEAGSGATVFDMSSESNDMTLVNTADTNYTPFSPEST